MVRARSGKRYAGSEDRYVVRSADSWDVRRYAAGFASRFALGRSPVSGDSWRKAALHSQL